jgi:1-acyl-sn-glycerol-3-phosphate acyltransferase
MDTINYLWHVPMRYLQRAKTFNKASLLDMVIFGTLIRNTGMFPVYFVSDRSEEFRVEKDKQEAVNNECHEFLKAGGSLTLFPEGRVSRNPRVINDLRFGSISLILEHRLTVYYILSCGNDDVWPYNSIGGYPANIVMYIGKYDADYADPNITAKTLAEDLKAEMQRQLNHMFEVKDCLDRGEGERMRFLPFTSIVKKKPVNESSC